MRWIASALILFYLGVLLLGPLTNPIGAPYLTSPLARSVAPVHQAFFMGHGYRFFGPDPGASHSVIYKIRQRDGGLVEGHFPDRDNTAPRLLYHRWFMLSETLYREGASVPNSAQWTQLQTQYDAKQNQFLREGKFELKQQLERERNVELLAYEAAIDRRDTLIRAIAKVLLDRHEGASIEMSIQERALPTPEEVISRVKLSDPSLLTSYPIGTFTREEISSSDPLRVFDPSQSEVPRGRQTDSPEIIFDGARQ